MRSSESWCSPVGYPIVSCSREIARTVARFKYRPIAPISDRTTKDRETRLCRRGLRLPEGRRTANAAVWTPRTVAQLGSSR